MFFHKGWRIFFFCTNIKEVLYVPLSGCHGHICSGAALSCLLPPGFTLYTWFSLKVKLWSAPQPSSKWMLRHILREGRDSKQDFNKAVHACMATLGRGETSAWRTRWLTLLLCTGLSRWGSFTILFSLSISCCGSEKNQRYFTLFSPFVSSYACSPQTLWKN